MNDWKDQKNVGTCIWIRTQEKECMKSQFDFYPFFCVNAIDWIWNAKCLQGKRPPNQFLKPI